MADRIVWIKRGVFIACLLPLLAIVADLVTGGLGVNPIEEMTHRTGQWALRLLLIGLAVTPVRRFFGWSWPLRLRRMLGLFAFSYALVHFLIWLVVDQFFHWPSITADIIKRPYITVGFLALLLLIPLAVTSTDAMMRRLGRNWRRLHRLVYPAAFLAVVHLAWQTRADWREPLSYAVVFALLMAARLLPRQKRWNKRAP